MVILSDHDGTASTSSGTSLERERTCDLYYDRYDVFLSFRGLDTRYGFTDHLYDHLKRAGIQTFRDNDELERGETLKKQLQSAIKQSSVSIIVFSQNYATSSWCLDELARILEQKKIRGDHYKVIPVFYQVEASDVRYQKGSYGEAFNRHREKGYVKLEKVNVWKAALTEAANLVGHSLNKGRPETEFIAEIVSEVEKHLPDHNALDVPEHYVGKYYWDNEINSWFGDRSKDNNVLVICGIGGIGKTSIAKHLFNQYIGDFKGSCFLANITARWDQIGVCGLQSQLLSNILNKREEIRIYSNDEGTKMTKRAICSRKVLVVLDDVSETEQLEALLGKPQRLCPGSKVLVTTRNMSLQKDFIITPKVHNVVPLNNDDSLKLFSWHAFRQLVPLQEYIQLSMEILSRCGGLPLALEVLGSSLRKKLDIIFWKKQLQKWDEIANRSIQKVMQISYDSLEDDTVKNLFLHVACFFVGEEKEYVVKILDHCGLHAMVGIQSLTDRCLMSTSYDNKLMMHQVIQDMGREIVRTESPNEPGRRSRLWCHEDSCTVLKYNMGTEIVQGLILDGQKLKILESDESNLVATDVNPNLITKVISYVNNKKIEVLDRFLPSKEGELKIDSFAKMVNLKLVKLHHVHLTGRCNQFPERLRWISWHGFHLEYVPMEFPMENLVALDLQYSKLKQVWKGYKEVKSLKFLNLSYSLELRETPDFRGLPLLERLILKGCSNLVKVCKSIGILKGLMLVDLSDCMRLRDLPDLSQSVETLTLSGCHLSELPNKTETSVPSSLVLGSSKILVSLPHYLVKLLLRDCNLSDECFPRDFSSLSSLNYLDLSGNLITRLPDCIRNQSNSRLGVLYICDCPHLKSVIYSSTLRFMNAFGNKQLQKVEVGRNRVYIDDGTTLGEYVEIKGCFKRVEAGNVEKKVIKNMGLESLPIGRVEQIMYEYGIFSTFVECTRVPHCFETHFPEELDGGEELEEVPYDINFPFPVVTYTIPNSSIVAGAKIQGLNICFAIRLNLDCVPDVNLFLGHCRFCARLSNKTKNLEWSYGFSDCLEEASLKNQYKEAEGKGVKRFLWVSTWKCDDMLEAGDELEVFFHIMPSTFPNPIKICVEKCGIRTVYEDVLDYNTTTSFQDFETTDGDRLLLWTDKVDELFSNYRTPGTRYFFRSRLEIECYHQVPPKGKFSNDMDNPTVRRLYLSISSTVSMRDQNNQDLKAIGCYDDDQRTSLFM